MNVSCPECQSVFRVDPSRVPGPGVRARCSVCGGIIPITAARSWTDDFATPHDAASLTTQSRPAPRPGSGTTSAVADRADSGASSTATVGGTLTPPTGMPRTATPTRVPPFVPGRRPTPASASSVPQMPVASTAPPVSPPRSVPPSAAPAPTLMTAPAPPPAARATDVPIGAPIPRVQPPAPPVGPPAPLARPSLDDASPGASGSVAPRTGVEATPPRVDNAAPAKSPINPFLANDPNQKAKRLARALVSDMVAYHPQKRDEGLRAGTLKQLFREEIKKSYEEYVDQIGKEFAESTSHFQDALNDVLASGKKVF